MAGFLGNLLKNTLDLPHKKELGIEQAYGALALKPSDPYTKSWSTVLKFRSYWTKEEVLRRAWQKKRCAP